MRTYIPRDDMEKGVRFAQNDRIAENIESAARYCAQAISKDDPRAFTQQLHVEDDRMFGTDGGRLHEVKSEDLKNIPDGAYAVKVMKRCVNLTLEESPNVDLISRMKDLIEADVNKCRPVTFRGPPEMSEADTQGRVFELCNEIGMNHMLNAPDRQLRYRPDWITQAISIGLTEALLEPISKSNPPKLYLGYVPKLSKIGGLAVYRAVIMPAMANWQ